ncbi:hypothetical protein WICPIJ_004617 [Wickerhamomyces pijperi]|uniref:HRDC domain-containing protein n=1 Tax=Wickerhamomyces pijperi TaxID=599730 RepID=A0A9P8Q5J1_WICPI|nr:hypothetical protein WICPIJ_004617 [Wickerhamomyces pijperi]
MSFQVTEDILPKLGPSVRAASGLSSNDINFYKSVDKSIEETSNKASDRVLTLINNVLESLEMEDIKPLAGSAISESWKSVSNILDDIFEKADMALDEHKGTNVKPDGSRMKYLDDSPAAPNSQANQKIKKPQLAFKTPIDNTEAGPFKPLLTSKPFAILPFEETFKLTEETEDDPAHYKHPYETEILKQEYNGSILHKAEPQLPKDWDTTKETWVDSVESLNEMLSQLKQCTEIAVDLEHHDYRTYHGLVCLMQISSRDQDWVVDTLALREDLHVLNEVFADPQITKVLHGAFMDIIWLQRDLGLYVVSLFDTFHASKALGLPKMSLAYLLERFAQFKTSKKYQLADWRLRPLNNAMMSYARADTHFLLYIYDQLKNLLLDAGKMGDVLFDSRNVALRRFEYTKFRPANATSQSNVYSPVERADPWKGLVYQYNIPSSRAGVVKSLYEWRDQIARKEDESPRYIMSNQLLISIASLAPTDSAGVLAASPYTTEYVRRSSKDIALLVSKALERAEKESKDLFHDPLKSDSTVEVVSVSDIKNAETGFSKITLQEPQTNEQSFDSFSNESSFFGRISFNDKKVFSSADSTLVQFTAERIENIRNKLSLFDDNQSVDLMSIIPQEIAEQIEPVTNENSQEQESESVSEPEQLDMFENKEDVVVLKNKKRQSQTHKKKADFTELTSEDFNYANADKVIVKQNRFAKKDKKDKKDKKRPSSEPFDPYSQIPDDHIRPAKKRSKPSAGKTISFVKKPSKK